MRKRLPILLLCMLLLLAGCKEKVTIGETKYPIDTVELDLSGAPLENVEVLGQFTQLKALNVCNTGINGETYDKLTAMLPGCQITWTPMFQGKAYPADTTALTVAELTGTEEAELAYFPKLTHLDATACRDYAGLLGLMTQYPQLQVDYVVELGGQNLPADATEAVFADISEEDLQIALKLLPQLKGLKLTGELPAAEVLSELQEVYSYVTFDWDVEVCGMVVSKDIEELDLSGIAVADVSEVEDKLGYLPQLKKVTMCDCGVPNEDMDALNRRHEDVRFIWNVTLGPYITVRTDLTEFIVYKYKYKYYLDDEAAYNLRYCTDMICLDLGHNEITNCEFVAFMPNLKYLVIADTEISDLTPLTGLTNLKYLEAFLCPIEDYSPLATLTGLEDLNIGYTQGRDATPLMQMTWLKRLWWSKCKLSMEARVPVREALPNTEFVTNQESSTGGGWRTSQNYYDMRDMLGMHYMHG